jgi:hypothetical protein
VAGTIPNPRSYQQTLGDILTAFLSRYGLKGLKVGGPILSILEAAAQSDVRNTQDIFNLLDAIDIDRATGIALDRLAQDEDVVRLPVSPSSGAVTISDSSFTKVSTKIYAGTAAPNAGTTALKVADGSKFPASGGALYIGRGTVNYEGPINYTNVTQTGTYWTITLSPATQKFHDLNESVILKQGGNRTVPAGSVVQTAQGNVATAVTFTTVNAATIADGDTSVEGVDVVCQQSGVIGNVPMGAVSQFTSPPFTGASVTNPLPFDNGQAAEDDVALRERIKAVRQSRSLGTALALVTYAKRAQAVDENKTVVSANVSTFAGEPTTLYIDDGTGYEELTSGTAQETLLDQAVGGEQYFKLSGALPVTKAFAKTSLASPFALVAGATLSVKVAGLLSEHSFSESEFRSIGNATAYEVVGAINGNPNLGFSARASDNGTKVVVFARTDTNEDVEVVAPATGINANTYLGFSKGVNYTLRLYKDDTLLYKDGKQAVVLTAPQSSWSSSIASGVFIKVKVDQTTARTYKITNQDFVDAGTGYTVAAATNSLDAWAKVFNLKIPGVVCTASNGRLQFISARDADSVAALSFSEPTTTDRDIETGTLLSSGDATNNLIQKGMFSATEGLSASGRNNDYTLNRNTGEIKLQSVLASGSSLTAGSAFTRAYVQSSALTDPLTIALGGGRLWVTVDGAAATVPATINAGVSFTLTNAAASRVRYTASSTAAYFANVQKGDWVVIWDPNFSVRGAWRVSDVDTTNYTWFEIDRSPLGLDTGVFATSNGVVFVRTQAPVQTLRVAAGSRSLSSLVTELNTQVRGATASVFKNTKLRLTTDTFGTNGSIYVVAADAEGQKLGLPRGTLVVNSSSHMPASESVHEEVGTPTFTMVSVSAVSDSASGFQTFTTSSTLTSGPLIHWMRRLYAAGTGNTLGVTAGTTSIVTSATPYTVRTADSVYAGSLTRVGTTVTYTGAAHPFKPGDIVFQSKEPNDANFVDGYKVIATVPSSTTFTYTEAGAATTVAGFNFSFDTGRLASDRLVQVSPYAIGPNDSLSIIVDEDVTGKNYSLNLYRKIKASPGQTYATTMNVIDVDNNPNPLSTAFGATDATFFKDFALFMRARGKSHGGGASSTNKAILWRYARFGPEGNQARIAYTNPTAPNQDFALTSASAQYADLSLRLPSDAARVGANVFDTTRFTISVSTSGNGEAVVYTYSKPTVDLSRTGTTVTGTTGSVHGYAAGDVVYITSGDANFPSGAKTLITASGSTFTYIESGAAVSTTGQAVSSAPSDPIFTVVTVGDIVTIGSGAAFATANKGTFRVTARTATTFTVQRMTAGATGETTPVSIVSASNISFYPIKTASTAASAIVSWVNTNASAFVSAVAVDNGGGSPRYRRH